MVSLKKLADKIALGIPVATGGSFALLGEAKLVLVFTEPVEPK